MLDQETPPEAEGEADGVADAAHRIARDSPAVAIASNTAVSIPPPWITAIAAHWPGTRARADGGRPGFAPAYAPVEPEPLPPNDDANSRIFAFVDDLFFQAKIQETARKLNVKVEFVKNEKDLLERIKLNGEEKPSLVIFDMNNVNAKPLTLIPKLKTKLKKTSIIGFLSHVQGDLKQKAHEVGCDMVLPRSAFSQNLPQLLTTPRRPGRRSRRRVSGLSHPADPEARRSEQSGAPSSRHER